MVDNICRRARAPSRRAKTPAFLVLALVLVILAGAVPATGAVRAQEPVSPLGASALAALPSSPGRWAYLTSGNYAGANADTACAPGFRLASAWEIIDPSNWRYASNHLAAYNKADSGSGPPANWYGWVRTGWDSSTENTAGTANCANWTSLGVADYGSIMRLSTAWETAPGSPEPWQTRTWSCAGSAPVWCVSDVYTVNLPLVTR
jgi:hypothetical protein